MITVSPMCQMFIKKVKKQRARKFDRISWNSNHQSPCEINRELLQCSFAGGIPLPPTEFVKQFSVTHDKSFVVIYLPNEGDNSQGIIDHSRM